MNTDTIIVLPERLEAILQKDQRLNSYILSVLKPFSDILKANHLYFFPEYTDHGIKHIEDTLQYTENLIADDTFNHLTSKEVGVILLSTVLHDIGMHTNADMFRNMIEGKYDNLSNLFPEGKTWRELWDSFLYDSQYWGEEKKEIVFGKKDYNIRIPDLSDLQGLTLYDRKLIGDFIRVHHCRIAHEIAIDGYIGDNTIPFGSNTDQYSHLINLAGIVARSHGMDIRDTFDYLEKKFGDTQTPFGIHVVYLMALLRLADYLQIDSSRTSLTMSLIDPIYSPYSKLQHKIHRSISNVQFENNDKEKILIHANPEDAEIYVNIEWLADGIQKEFDRSWAILGEVYADSKYKLKYRRITTNISNPRFKNSLPYVPKQFGFRYNKDLFKLLIAPLYSDDPSFGVRELVQNSVDACKLCMDEIGNSDEPDVIVNVDTKKSLFTITDRGKGMNLYEIEHYFLTIGSSYNESIDWQKYRDKNHLYRTGRFGIGVLAAFLIGPEITVETRKRGEDVGYRFTASLYNKFIQIEKVNDAAFGTTISIKCNKTVLEELENYSTEDEYSSDHDWNQWYIGERPKVAYYYDGVQLSSRRKLEGYQVLEHSSDSYGTILWKPSSLYYDSLYRDLYCNGFFITDFSHKNHFSLPGFRDFDYLRIPSLQITDTYNQLPLNLQRTDIDEDTVYDFEPELAKAVFIDTMCQLMAFNPAMYRQHTRDEQVLLFSDGFSLSSPYIWNCVKVKTFIRFYVSEKTYYQDFDLMLSLISMLHNLDCCIVCFNYSYYEHHLERLTSNSLELASMEKSVQAEEYRIKIGDVSFALSNDYKLEQYRLRRIGVKSQANPEWMLINANPTIERLFEQLIIHFSSTHISAILAESRPKKANPKTVIDDLFEKYMHMDPVVPYEFEERKKKFPLLFQDYGEVIEQYRSSFNLFPTLLPQ